MASFSFHMSGLVLILFANGVQGELHTIETTIQDDIQNESSIGTSLHKPFLELQQEGFEPGGITHWAMLFSNGTLYGGMGTLNVYQPEVANNQASSALIWARNGNEAIQAGWQVNPELHGDHRTHFFVVWTSDGFQTTGCYNLECQGFVLDKTTKYVPGYILNPVSSYNGIQYHITLKISKDPRTGDWWLHYGLDGNNPIGYWPKSLFTQLKDSASEIAWGGATINIENETGPPMGSGHFPEEGDKKAAYLQDVKLVDKDGKTYDPDIATSWFLIDKKSCYNIIESDRFYFGGPGGCIEAKA